MKLDDILSSIRNNGGRITKVRRAILEAFYQSGCLVSQEKIVAYLATKELTPNPSTIFRELQFLLKSKIITKSTINKVHHYELNSNHRHYHFVCSKCQGITALHLHNPLISIMKELEQQHQFKIQQHSIDFKGICISCS